MSQLPSPRSSLYRPVLVVAASAFAVVVPFFFWGNPSGHDFEFHLFSWMEVVAQWKEGILYPRWAALAYWGYGEARFVFYPPSSWTLGALIGTVLPWKIASGVYIWVALTASGISMYFLAKRWLEPPDAAFAAGLYAANPYYIVVVYWRSAFAELLAGALLPLLLLCLLRIEANRRQAVLGLSLIVTAAWLTNLPAAVMINYSLALLVVILAVLRRSPRPLLYGGLAVILGAALAGFYLVPAVYEQKWVNIGEVLAPGVRPQDNFLFTPTSNPDHNRFNLLISIVTLAEIAILAAAAWLSRRWRSQQREVWWMLLIWAAAASLLMFPLTLFLWQHLPKLRFVQLPLRLLLCLNVAFALLLTMGARRWFSRAALCLGMLAVITGAGRHIQPPWWDDAGYIAEMHDSVRDGQGYEGIDEYVPAGADRYELNQTAPQVMVEGDARARVEISQWGPQSKSFLVHTSKSARLVLRLFNYPAWKVKVNGRPAAAQTKAVTGQMVIPVETGENDVQITFARTWDRTAGALISLAAILLAVAIWIAKPPGSQVLKSPAPIPAATSRTSIGR